MAELCPPCREKWIGWLDYKLPPESPLSLRSMNAQQMADHQEARYREWQKTIRTQQRLIEDACRAQHLGGGEMSRKKDREAAEAYEQTHADALEDKRKRGELAPESERKKNDDENGNGD